MIKTFIISFSPFIFLFTILNICLHHLINRLSFLKCFLFFFLLRFLIFSHLSKNSFPIDFFCFKYTLVFLFHFNQLSLYVLNELIASLQIGLDFSFFTISYLFGFYFIEEFPELFIGSFLVFRVRILCRLSAVKGILQKFVDLSGVGESFRA
jgi:hypothetical protein